MYPKPYSKVIPYGRQSVEKTDIDAVVETLKSDFVTQGPRVASFEDALCELTGARYAVAVSSGTAALHLACQGLGLGRGDVGAVPAITFAATANCLRYVGAEVAFCDVDPVTGLATAASFQAVCESRKIKAMLPVSYSGSVCELDKIASLAGKSGAFVIEDAAHSIGATYQDSNDRVFRSASCEHSDAAILSFHPVKHVCAGEGGVVLTNDNTLAQRVRRLRSHGIEKGEAWEYDQVELGSHYRMTDIQAALGESQLKRLGGNLDRRRELVERYLKAFEKEPFASRIRVSTTDVNSAWHLFVVHFQDETERRAAYEFFHQRNVRVQVHYLPVYRHGYYAKKNYAPLEGAEAFYSTCLSLPMYPTIKYEEQEFVTECLRAFLSND